VMPIRAVIFLVSGIAANLPDPRPARPKARTISIPV
jgi:hypothetical protein